MYFVHKKQQQIVT